MRHTCVETPDIWSYVDSAMVLTLKSQKRIEQSLRGNVQANDDRSLFAGGGECRCLRWHEKSQQGMHCMLWPISVGSVDNTVA